MKEIYNRHSIILFISSFLILSIVFASNTLGAYENSNTIIVNQDGSGDFITITEAIQAAQSGDIIQVHKGEYKEDSIFINKTISLIGEEKISTIIKGDGTTTIFSIHGESVSVQGFTITGGGGNLGQNIDITGNNCVISENIITFNDDVGIAIHQSSHSIISSNIISNCPFAGIRIYNCNQSNTITNNTISDCITALYVYESQNQLIEKNNVTQCSNGIYLEECMNNLVMHNQISENAQGMFVSYAKNNLITENNFISNDEHAKFAIWISPTGLQLSEWDRNYWDDNTGFLPKLIPGILFIRTYNPIGIFLPWFALDWHPQSEPYHINS